MGLAQGAGLTWIRSLTSEQLGTVVGHRRKLMLDAVTASEQHQRMAEYHKQVMEEAEAELRRRGG